MKYLPMILIPLVLSACGSDSGTVVGTADTTDQSGSEVDDSGSDNDDTGTDDTGSGNEGGNGDTTDITDDTANTGTTAQYRLTFNATWSAGTHAQDFPGNPHFSGLVGAVHNEQVIFWEAGQIATSGVEEVAETGGKNLMLQEVATAIANGYAVTEISGAGITTSPDTTSIEFEVSQDYPQITVSTMVAPSPDWFVGVHNLALFDGNEFVDSITIELPVYDAGTDSGVAYTSDNLDTSPRDPIMLLTSDSADTPFRSGLPVVGEFVIEKLP